MSENGRAGNGNKSTGPRTSEGKAITKLNAITHGIFSRVVVLKGESQEDYNALLAGLQEACEPEGMLENTLVDKMASILWRHRRLLTAEGGEIQGLLAAAETAMSPETSCDIDVKNTRIEQLAKFRDAFRDRGFKQQEDRRILKLIGGKSDPLNPTATVLLSDYEYWLEQSSHVAVKQCQEKFLELLEKEINRLQQTVNYIKTSEAQKLQLSKAKYNIPNDPGVNRILRYEAGLERAFDRALTQLERLQRIRLGLSVPPPIKLDVAH